MNWKINLSPFQLVTRTFKVSLGRKAHRCGKTTAPSWVSPKPKFCTARAAMMISIGVGAGIGFTGTISL